MRDVAYSIYYFLLGIWAAALLEIAWEAKREQGGSMPLAAPFGVVWLVGGLLVFLLLHILIRKIWGRP